MRTEIKTLKTKLRKCKEKLKLTQKNVEDAITKEKDKYENEILDMKKKYRNKVNELKCHILQLQHQLSLQQPVYDSSSLNKRSSWTGGDVNVVNPAEVLSTASTPSSPTGMSLLRRTPSTHSDRKKRFILERKYTL